MEKEGQNIFRGGQDPQKSSVLTTLYMKCFFLGVTQFFYFILFIFDMGEQAWSRARKTFQGENASLPSSESQYTHHLPLQL